MKNKFNIGDKVMVRGDLEIGEWYGGLVFLPLMVEHCGTISEIINVEFRNNYSCCYFLKDMYSPVGYPWYWSEEMLENPVVHLCNVEIKKVSKDSEMGSLKISKVSESHEWANKKVKEEPLKKNDLMDESEEIVVRRVITDVFGELMDYLEKTEKED